MEKKIDNTNIDNIDKKLIISDVINSITLDILKELYQMAHDDGWNAMADTEYPDSFEVKGFDKVIEELYKKHCL